MEVIVVADHAVLQPHAAHCEHTRTKLKCVPGKSRIGHGVQGSLVLEERRVDRKEAAAAVVHRPARLVVVGGRWRATRLVTGFDRPIDSVLVDTNLYVLDYGGGGSSTCDPQNLKCVGCADCDAG